MSDQDRLNFWEKEHEEYLRRMAWVKEHTDYWSQCYRPGDYDVTVMIPCRSAEEKRKVVEWLKAGPPKWTRYKDHEPKDQQECIVRFGKHIYYAATYFDVSDNLRYDYGPPYWLTQHGTKYIAKSQDKWMPMPVAYDPEEKE